MRGNAESVIVGRAEPPPPPPLLPPPVAEQLEVRNVDWGHTPRVVEGLPEVAELGGGVEPRVVEGLPEVLGTIGGGRTTGGGGNRAGDGHTRPIIHCCVRVIIGR